MVNLTILFEIDDRVITYPFPSFFVVLYLDDLVKSQEIPLPWWEGTKGRGISS